MTVQYYRCHHQLSSQLFGKIISTSMRQLQKEGFTYHDLDDDIEILNLGYEGAEVVISSRERGNLGTVQITADTARIRKIKSSLESLTGIKLEEVK